MVRLWLILVFWLALALPGYALTQRWDRESLERGLMFGLARCYLASFTLLTPAVVLGYWLHWPVWSLSVVYVAAVSWGAWALVREGRALFARIRPNWLAAFSCVLIGFDLWLGLRAGAHTLGDAGYHIARVRMLMAEGLSNWDPIVQHPQRDLIYHTNLYHALIAVSGQLTRSDAALAWIATWPFAKLLMAAGIAQLAGYAFGAASYGWLASLAVLVSQSAYSALPLPNTLAPLAILPMGLCAGAQLLSEGRRAPLSAAWLAASAIALAQLHALNAIFLALVVAPALLGVLMFRALPALSRGRFRPPTQSYTRKRSLALGILACAASAPWLAIAGAPRIEALLDKAGASQSAAEQHMEQTAPAELAAGPSADTQTDEPAASVAQAERIGVKAVYKAERFRKLDNGLSVYEPSQLRGAHDVYSLGLAVAVITLLLRPRKQLLVLLVFVGFACAWLVVPQLCSLLLFVTGAPWAALRVNQVLPVVFYALVPAAPLYWFARWREPKAPVLPAFALPALLIGWTQIAHGEPWTPERVWEHALQFEARAQWQSVEARQALLCAHIPSGEMVMAHPRWDYGLPMHCRNFAVALAPGRGWHGMPYMPERRADVDEFFRDGTTGPRRVELMRKYGTHYVYTSQRLARRIVSSLPKESRLLAGERLGAVVSIDY